MSALSDYAVSIVVIVGAVALATFISYKGELAPAERCAAAIIVTATAIIPIGDLISSVTVTPPTVEDFIGEDKLEFEEVGEDAFCDGLSLLISEKYGLDSKEVRVAVEGFSFAQMRAEGITVILSGGAVVADAPAIESYISSLGIGECRVEIEI